MNLKVKRLTNNRPQARALCAAALLSCMAAGAAEASEQRHTFRDERGRITGSAVTRPGGRADFYDQRGRKTGRMECSGTGCRVYDARGRRRGTIREQSAEQEPMSAPLVTIGQWRT